MVQNGLHMYTWRLSRKLESIYMDIFDMMASCRCICTSSVCLDAFSGGHLPQVPVATNSWGLCGRQYSTMRDFWCFVSEYAVLISSS